MRPARVLALPLVGAGGGEPAQTRDRRCPVVGALRAVRRFCGLQRGAGNQAVARMLARRVEKPKRTGIRDDAAIARYVRKAVIFLRNNSTARLFHLANFLGAAANTELNRLGVPDVKVHADEPAFPGSRGRVEVDPAPAALKEDDAGK
jgi:hypothetical protein